jgi:hypothetical protein
VDLLEEAMKLKRLGVVTIALLAAGCVPQVDTKAGDQVAADFYRQIAAKQYETAYQGAAPELRNGATLELFIGMMQRIDRKLGACGPATKRAAWRVNVTTSGTMRDQGYSRACANGKLDETITTITRGGKTVLAGYHANSPVLATD